MICAALLPHVLQANMDALRATAQPLDSFNSIAFLLTGRLDAPAAVEQIRLLVDKLEIPHLGIFGFTQAHIPEIVALAKRASSMKFNPVILSDQMLADILRGAIG
jgi:alcohol dehydrogenase class IV